MSEAPGPPAERILVIKLSALGDFVQALAAMKRIREAHPGARITLLTTPPTGRSGRPAPGWTRCSQKGGRAACWRRRP